ncbi:uncharacterized protein MCYG_01779 [Microsporum canis CBS 113480]|uniref:Integral membrane protein n=1 Tax=Arthroderma otae (strain ATCC MYA-4605 / CBS 113480) TaxID=554155 RepID=C5FHY0_ARTOC|nr:uncharacterized protein MCYG_01779 [Microsporum canis CBS 113480]EEQ28960.1 integral membrane protein [Microsporum canis CBS 113480]
MKLNIGLPTDGIPNRGWQLWTTSIGMVVGAAIFVFLRLATRCFRAGIKVDDWTILVALACSIALTVAENSGLADRSIILAVAEGYGKHDQDVSTEHRIRALKWFFVAQVFYKLVISLSKCSILFLYLRIFAIEKSFRWACKALIVFNILVGIAFCFATVWQCHPMEAFWDPSISSKTCIDHFGFWLSYSVINITSDFIVLGLPIQQVARLQLRKEDKVALILVFGLGGFVCIMSIIRATTIAASASSTDATSLRNEAGMAVVLYKLTLIQGSPIPATIWSVVECNTGIICACTPMIRQPLSFLFPRAFVPLAQGGLNAPIPPKARGSTALARYSYEPPLVTSASAPWDSEEQLHPAKNIHGTNGAQQSTARA